MSFMCRLFGMLVVARFVMQSKMVCAALLMNNILIGGFDWQHFPQLLSIRYQL